MKIFQKSGHDLPRRDRLALSYSAQKTFSRCRMATFSRPVKGSPRCARQVHPSPASWSPNSPSSAVSTPPPGPLSVHPPPPSPPSPHAPHWPRSRLCLGFFLGYRVEIQLQSLLGRLVCLLVAPSIRALSILVPLDPPNVHPTLVFCHPSPQSAQHDPRLLLHPRRLVTPLLLNLPYPRHGHLAVRHHLHVHSVSRHCYGLRHCLHFRFVVGLVGSSRPRPLAHHQRHSILHELHHPVPRLMLTLVLLFCRRPIRIPFCLALVPLASVSHPLLAPILLIVFFSLPPSSSETTLSTIWA
ncbi:hypothetical protein PAPYR_5652 [Paratrimastix pyriformis]|uniref:Uncharacterized protein n=1 Tax=Paratrimastix pyriformis TaxID=342808 RepID=A0ABQ8UHE9_9EUKA|nr:hypothetical protein PAPYR_5652 [Paratrimastix pyriformis]